MENTERSPQRDKVQVTLPKVQSSKRAEVHKVPIESLKPAYSPRLSGEDQAHIRRLAEIDTPLPPIIVHRSTMRVVDGMHRLRAAAIRGQREIAVMFFDGTEAEAFKQAVEANVRHGLPLPLPDRKAAAEQIIASHPQLSDRAIAGCTGLSAKTVRTIRSRSTADPTQSNTRIGVDGRQRPVNSAEGRRRAIEFITQNPEATVREIARCAEISVGTAHKVLSQMRHPPSARAPEEDSPAPGAQLVQTLRRDPSMRQTDGGRRLLQMFHLHLVIATDPSSMMDAIPEHCSRTVIELARQCSEAWDQFARELKHRSRPRQH
jgi:hypothetical protein